MLISPLHAGPGEEVLQKFQMSRAEIQKLKDIEEKLSALQQVKKLETEAVVRKSLVVINK